MCRDCGCSLGPAAARAPFAAHPAPAQAPSVHVESIEVITAILDENDRVAQHNREHFDAQGVLAINLMSSPGSGKTSLLEATIKALAGELKVAVIEGDLATENDAARIRACGVPAVQIQTGNACHLDAQMVHDVLHDLPLGGLDVLFVENVGNLVCPGELRPRRAPQRHAAVGPGRRRQAREVSGDVPRGRPHADHQGRPAAAHRGVQRRARARLAAPGGVRRHHHRSEQARRRGFHGVARLAAHAKSRLPGRRRAMSATAAHAEAAS